MDNTALFTSCYDHTRLTRKGLHVWILQVLDSS